MPNFTIENTSPLIQYLPTGSWREGDKVQDPESFRYSGNGSFTLTQQFGAQASFSFNGTSISINGAKRLNHGPYSVILDGKTTSGNGESSQDLFQTPLFSADNLSPGFHTITIINESQDHAHNFLDIDSISWSSPETENRTMEDTDMTYEPPNSWTTDTANLPGFSSGTAHSTSQAGASVTIQFDGTGISVFSAVGPSLSSFGATLDNGPPTSFNATKNDYYPQQMIYHAVNLSSGKHSLKLSSEGSGQMFAVDYATIYGPASSSPRLPTGAIVATVLGSLAVIALIFFGFAFWIRKRRRRRDSSKSDSWKGNYFGSRSFMNGSSGDRGIDSSSAAQDAPLDPPKNAAISAWRDSTRMFTINGDAENPGPSQFAGTLQSQPPRSTISGYTGLSGISGRFSASASDDGGMAQLPYAPPSGGFATPGSTAPVTSGVGYAVGYSQGSGSGRMRTDFQFPPRLPEPQFGSPMGNSGKRYVNLM